MTAKLVGVLLIGAASLYTGGALISAWQRRVEQLAAFCRLVTALEDGIGKMGLPVQQIVGPFTDPVLEAAGYLPTVRSIWASDPTAAALGDAFAAYQAGGYTDAEENRLLSRFFAELGSGERAGEAERCAYVRARLQAIYDGASTALPARCRIAGTLAGALGCAAALMLL